MDEELLETSGVEDESAAGTDDLENEATEDGQETAESGDEEQVAAEPEQEKIEKAFAARLAAEKAKLEQQYNPSNSFLQREAARFGMSVPQYMQAVEQQRREQEEEELREKGIDPQMLHSVLDKHPDIQRARALSREMEIKQLADQPFFAELEADIRGMVRVNPNIPAHAAYKFLAGEKMPELIKQVQEKAAKEAEEKTIKGLQNQRKGKAASGTTNASAAKPSTAGMSIRDSLNMYANEIDW